MSDRRQKNREWDVTDAAGRFCDRISDGVFLAIAMDIRDELQMLNRLLGCGDCMAIPEILRSIRANTSRIPVRKKKVRI